ncbi:MAG TPA: hypothetical protein VFV66_24080 [Nonomuraea sp.]|nr:hypothetical protein [Nonomuraea sp.]
MPISAEIPDNIDLEAPENYRLARIPITYLDHFPGNVREDLHLTTEYCASLKQEQQVIITVIPIPTDHQRGPEENPEALFWVVKGNRRLGGARKIKLDTLLCLIDLTKADQQALLYIDQVVENDEDYRRPLTVWEKTRALTLAFEAGATRTEIRKRTGRTRKEIAEAIAAGQMSEQTRATAQALEYEWTLDELAMLADFDGDDDALARVQDMMSSWNYSARHAIEVVRRERAEAAAHAAAVAEMEAAGVMVTPNLPPGAMRLSQLAVRVQGFDPDGHADCAGHGAFFFDWRPQTPEFYCSTPDAHGYVPLPEVATLPARSRQEEVPRKIVMEGNRAWMAAATVRQEWLADFLARKTAPKLVQRFVTRILNEMPGPVRDKLASASRSTLYAKLGGPADLHAALATATPGRLAILQLLPIAVAWEYQMSDASGDCKSTWRPDRYSPCSTQDAAAWLRFLVNDLGPELGEKAYRPSPIEQALIDGTPYRGSAPAGQDNVVSDLYDEHAEPDSGAGDESGAPDQEEPVDNADVSADVDAEFQDANAADVTISEVLNEPEQELSLEDLNDAIDDAIAA